MKAWDSIANSIGLGRMMTFRRRGNGRATRSPEGSGGRLARAPAIGQLLREERERQDLTLPDVAAQLKIRRMMLEALEAGEVDRLPSPTYAIGFLRNYAAFLGLDGDEIVARFRAEVEPLNQPVELNFPTPIGESRLPGAAIVAVSLLVAALAYGLWYFSSDDEQVPLPRVAAVPPRLAPLVEEPALNTSPPSNPSPRQAEAATVSGRPAAEPPEKPAPMAEPIAAPPPTTEAAVLAPPAAPSTPSTVWLPSAASVGARSEAGGRIVLRATGDSWIRVRDAQGAILFTRTLKAGEAYNVPDRPGLTLFAGSAGTLEVLVDGKLAPSLGAPGEVRRDVPLDPARLLSGQTHETPRGATAPTGRPIAPGTSRGGGNG